MNGSYPRTYLAEVCKIAQLIEPDSVDRMLDVLLDVRRREGRLFFIGVGGSAGNCSHAVNDFRKIAGIESYAPTDNVSELTARINDDGWEGSFAGWLKGSRIGPADAVFIFSVGGGNVAKNVSINIVRAIETAKAAGARVIGIVGRDGGYTAQVADACIIVPTVNDDTVTPHTEAFQAVLWHLLVSHPDLRQNPMKWESLR